jgi:hypothetical protein
MVGTGLAPLTMNYLFTMEDFELTVEAIVDATGAGTRLPLLTMNYLFIMEDFELTVEAIVDATDGWDRVGPTHDELSLYYGGL